MTKITLLRDDFIKEITKPPPLDPRLAELVRLLARAVAKRDYDELLATGQQPNRRTNTETN